MELKEGMYVRAKQGKIIKIEKLHIYEHDKILVNINGYLVNSLEITKASYNIIDLIEVGDYVNGHQVYDDFRADTDDYGNNFIEIGIESDRFLNHYIREDEIKSIVTKEQFEAMKYEIK